MVSKPTTSSIKEVILVKDTALFDITYVVDENAEGVRFSRRSLEEVPEGKNLKEDFRELTMLMEDWEAIGSPETITITIELGDKING